MMQPVVLERPPAEVAKPVRSAKETAAYLDVAEAVVLRLIREGRLHSVRAGRRHLISQRAIDAFLAGER